MLNDPQSKPPLPSGAAAQAELVDEVRLLPADKAFRVYAELLAQSPQQAQLAALALREKARAGEIGDEHIPVLDACLADAPDAACVVHFAKALAAFGRTAQSAAPTLIDKIKDLHVMSDAGYWVLDGSLFALGFLGGDVARSFLASLVDERPSRAVKSESVYVGQMTKAEREERYAECLARVQALIAQKDAGSWREKKTELVAKKAIATAPPKKSWMVR